MRWLVHLVSSLAAVLPCTKANSDQLRLSPSSGSNPEPYRVAIIGAGAGGSSAAYHLSKFANESKHNIPIAITIFEANDRIGGRTTTVEALNDPRYPVELGGSIFVEINQILYNATRDFGLPANGRIYESTGADYDLGIWDGNSFIFTTVNDDEDSGLKGTLSGWWDIAKLLWKYGLSPVRLRSVQQGTIRRFLRMYDEVFPFHDLTKAAEDVDLLSVTRQTGPELLTTAGVGEKFSRDIIQASTRVNYAQNLDRFHGLETMVCMSTEGAMSIEGGNWQIFDEMIRRSGAEVNFNTSIQEISTTTYRTNPGRSSSELISADLWSEYRIGHGPFDQVILAAPYNASALKLSPPPTIEPQTPDYVSIHVTLFTTAFRPNPQYFGLNHDESHLVPDTILTTLPPNYNPTGRGSKAVGPTKIWSLSTLRTLRPTEDGHIPYSNLNHASGHIPLENLLPREYEVPDWPGLNKEGKQYLYKIFSPEPLRANHLIDLFGWCNHPSLPPELIRTTCNETPDDVKDRDDSPHYLNISMLPDELLTWMHEKRWDSYPYLPPTDEFDCFDIYDCKGAPAPEGMDLKDLKGRLWHTSPIEKFISTMETSALSGRNIARLIVDQLEAGE